MKRLQRDLALAIAAFDLHDRIEGDQRHAEIRRMGGDAGLAPAEHGMQPVFAVAGVATRTGLAFVAGAGGVVKVSAARPLQQIAADGGGVAKLCGRAGQKCFGHGRTGAREFLVMGEIGIADQRADADAAIGQMFDAIEPRQAGDVDETVRTADPALHQVEQIGAGSEIERIPAQPQQRWRRKPTSV